MTTRPAEIPTWATNELFASVGDSWDTDPTKVEPSAGRKAEGWEPTQLPPAEFMNWMMNRYGRWIEHLSEITLWNWFDGIALTGGNVWKFAHDSAMALGFGRFVAVMNDGARERSDDGLLWTAAATPGASTLLSGAASDQASLIVVVGSTATLRSIETTTDGSIYTNRTPAAAGAPGDLFEDVVWDPKNSLWVICGNGEVIETSPNGTAWTSRTTPATDDLKSLAVNGTPIIVAVGDAGKILTSADGVTWTARTSGTATNLNEVVWSSDLARFFAISATVLLTSADGISWSTATHPGSSMVALGTDGRVLYATGGAGGPAFSVDGGSVWKQIDRTDIHRIDFVRGRFFGGGASGAWFYTLRFEQ